MSETPDGGQRQRWYVRLMGGLAAERASGGRRVEKFRSQKVAGLLAYLALHRAAAHARADLTALLWPGAEENAARANLRTALSLLRQELERPGEDADGSVLATRGHSEVWLDRDAVTTDVARFEALLEEAGRARATRERAERLAEAVALYAPLLPGRTEPWVGPERERLEESYRDALRRLVAYHEQNRDWDAALEAARRAVAADPLREEPHRELIRLLVAAGRGPEADSARDEMARRLGEAGVPLSDGERRLPDPEGDAAVTAAVTSTAAASPPQVRLPLTLTRFFGRDEEIRGLHALLRPGDGAASRLVTLSGPGGAGKTRLAVEVARRSAADFPGGVWFVPLADVREGGRVHQSIADALAIPRVGMAQPLDQIVHSLNGSGGAPTLLVLDNFEQIVEEGAPQVREILEGAPGVTILVTSRQRLLIEGEAEFHVAPLATPPSVSDDPGGIGDYPSVRLFADRARAARTDFKITSRNAAVVADICRRLEGIPLALELAAAWSAMLTPSQMVERMDRRLDLLVSRRRDAPDRHATLRAAVDWSYQLLPEQVRVFFLRLGVFDGGWTLEAAEAVTGEARALEFLTELRERSLVLVEEMPGGEMRYRMLETLREFAAERLSEDAPLRADMYARHRDYFLSLASGAGPGLRGEEQMRVLRLLERELPNLRAALDRALAWPGSARDAARLAAALAWFWTWRSHFREGYVYLLRALDALPGPGGGGDAAAAADGGDEGLRASLHQGVATVAYFLGETEVAEKHLRTALPMTERRGDVAAAAFTYFGLSIVYSHHEERFDRSLEYGRESLRLAEAVGDPWLLCRPLIPLATVLLLRGEAAAALEYNDRNVELLRALEDNWELAHALFVRGLILRAQGQIEEADAAFREHLALSARLENPLGIVWALCGLAGTAVSRGRYARAARLRGASDQILDTLQVRVNPLPGTSRARFDADADVARRALGDAAYAAAREEGRGWTLAEAVTRPAEEPFP
ncbi:MAG TPA: tetratricopeptide repeat protein [Armatimonadaceae bacterium]|nr:tetratricopeptide repeat protein [Armatimonadaceae bacterium]